MTTLPKKETATAKKARTAEVLARLAAEYPDSRCALDYRSPFELLVATILAAQCTDERVNRTTPELFLRLPTPRHLAETSLEEIEELIHSTGFYKSKARSLKGLGADLVAEHKGQVPRSMDALVKLPGVGRKTANVVLGNAFGDDVGFVVDTHVSRLSQRLGLTQNVDPEKIERDLMTLVPRDAWTVTAHRLIDHGRKVCAAKKPACGRCVLAELCPSAQL